MSNRRKFLSQCSAAMAGLWVIPAFKHSNIKTLSNPERGKPVVLATWNNKKATSAAYEALIKSGSALDAVEAGAMVPEADPNDTSVGYGGFPDRDGNVTLDACIMDASGNAGSVTFLQHIKHPISVARKVMEETPHVMLSGKGALDFALSQGFKKEELLTEKAKEAWEKWKIKSEYKPEINIERHDTIGILALDKNGRMAGACTTSGLAFKMHGRVGDSPIIGAGLYVDNEVGGAVATGHGEFVMKTLGSFLIVELMRQGKSPQQACEEAVNRISRKYEKTMGKDFQIGYLAMDMAGNSGAYSFRKGFNYVKHQEQNDLFESSFLHE